MVGKYVRTKETREKMSKVHKGKKKWINGRIFTKQWKENLSKAHKGQAVSEETKRKISLARKGTKLSEETKRKMSKTKAGKTMYWMNRKRKPLSEETKKKISEAHKGMKKPWVKGQRISGEKNHFWKGGKSFEPYTTDWTRTLRQSIRERDKYRCQLCGEPQGDKALCVHHIDYNKKNCNPNNLISLCGNCHIKTNFNRGYWIQFL